MRVMGFNTVNSKVLEREAHRNGDRVGIPLAGDSQEALELVAQLVRDAGFDPVIVGALARGRSSSLTQPPTTLAWVGGTCESCWSTLEAAFRDEAIIG
jgi:predicted dinucleotide-binding enzyme